jgi:hypothetical protein
LSEKQIVSKSRSWSLSQNAIWLTDIWLIVRAPFEIWYNNVTAKKLDEFEEKTIDSVLQFFNRKISNNRPNTTKHSWPN